MCNHYSSLALQKYIIYYDYISTILILIRFFLSEIFNAKILYGYINMIIFFKCFEIFLSVQLIYYILRSSKFTKKITIYPLYV